MAWCCTPGRAGQTFHATGVMNYWLGVIGMIFCPCFTLFYANRCTDMNQQLGGEKKGVVMGFLCALCCQCCVVAQDAQALDYVTETTTGCCGLTREDGSPLE